MENADINFRFCRACLSSVQASSVAWDFFNLHDGNGENAEKLKVISGIDVRQNNFFVPNLPLQQSNQILNNCLFRFI